MWPGISPQVESGLPHRAESLPIQSGSLKRVKPGTTPKKQGCWHIAPAGIMNMLSNSAESDGAPAFSITSSAEVNDVLTTTTCATKAPTMTIIPVTKNNRLMRKRLKNSTRLGCENTAPGPVHRLLPNIGPFFMNDV